MSKRTQGARQRTREYHKVIAEVNKDYARLEREYTHKQVSGASLVALQHQRNERLARIAELYYTEQFPFYRRT